MAFDVQAALKDGYSSAEIADYLASKRNFDIESARKDGYSDDDILSYLSAKIVKPVNPEKPLPEGVTPSEGRSATPMGKPDPRLVKSEGPGLISNAMSADDYRAAVEKRKQETPERTLSGSALDAGITLLKGVIGLPESFVGLADIPSGGAVGKVLEKAGYKPNEAKEILDTYLSEAQQAANRKVRETKGFLPTVGAALENPSTIAASIGESLPQMLGGAAVGRGVVAAAPKVAPWIAGAVGEGVLGAGSAAEQTRAGTEDKLLTGKQSLAAVGSGVGTAIFGAAGGRLANRLGLDDVETMLVAGSSRGGPAKSVTDFAKRAVGSGVSEGVFEEMPQSAQEKMWSNYATDRPLLEGVPEAMAQGLVTGFAMGAAGGGAGAVTRTTPEQEIAKAIEQNVAGAQWVAPAEEVARDRLSPYSAGPNVLETETQPIPVAPTSLQLGQAFVTPADPTPITQAGSVDEAINAAQTTAGAISAAPLAPVSEPVAAAAALPGLTELPPIAAPVTTAELPGAAPAAETLPGAAPAAAALPPVNPATEQQFGLDKLRLNAPRPQRIQGTPVAQLTDDQLTAISADETVPAITRRSAAVELQARGAETTLPTAPAPTIATNAELPGQPSPAMGQPVAQGGTAPALGGVTPGAPQLAQQPAPQLQQPGALDTTAGAQAVGLAQPLKLARTARLKDVGQTLKQVKTDLGVDAEIYNEPLTEAQQAASALGRVMGNTVTFLKAAPGQLPNGMVVPSINPKDVYIAADADAPVLGVAVHEITHLLPQPVKTKLNAGLRALFNDNYLPEFAAKRGLDLNDTALLDEEIPAYISQAISERPDFWQDLRAKMGDGDFAEVARVILDKLNDFLAGTSREYGDEFLNRYVTDVAKARDLLSTAYADAMKAQGKPVPVATKGGIQASERVEPAAAEAPAPTNPVDAASLDDTFKLAQSRTWQRGRDLKMAMQQRVLDAASNEGLDVTTDTPEVREYLRKIGMRDALAALKQNANAIGWYDLKTRQALAVMSLVHPEIAKNQDARFALTWAMAVTSNGLKVGKNFELAEKVYEIYKKTGRMPTNVGIGTAGNAINDSLRLFNELRVAWGMDNLRKFMQTNFTVSEITGISKNLKPGGEHADVTVKGAAILGPKIGNGFFSNLYGNFDSLTMDRWLVRTWGRWTGTLIKPMPEQTAKARDRLTAAVNEIVKNPAEAKRLGDLVDLPITANTDVDALATAVQESSMDPEIRAKLNESEVGLELRKAGNSLAKYLDGQKEAPQGPTERKFIRAIFSDVLAELQQRPEYQALTMADLQAVLWYAEKRLYETAKEDPNADEDIEGYSDDDAPDYANAAADVARQKGVPDARIKAALKKEEQNGRSTGTRPATASGIAVPPAVAAGKPTAAGGFTGREKRQFIGERAVLRARADRTSDGQQSPAFTGDGGKDGGRVRVLKALGVSYTQKWKASRETATVFRANDMVLPGFVELAPTLENAQQFQKAIADNKAKHPFGAAVYVYPAEDYRGMKLFLADDGQSGVAVKPDGDIVSVFSTGGAGRAVMELAVAAGGRKLDAFDTILPEFYAPHGFKAVARTKWNDDFAPDEWNKETFSEFNNGQPDVVFMVYDPAKMDAEYSSKDGTVMTGEDGYDRAVARQAREMKKTGKGAIQASERTVDSEAVFEGLDSRGLAKARAESALANRDDAAQVRFIQDNFLDILAELDDSGRVKINCD